MTMAGSSRAGARRRGHAAAAPGHGRNGSDPIRTTIPPQRSAAGEPESPPDWEGFSNAGPDVYWEPDAGRASRRAPREHALTRM